MAPSPPHDQQQAPGDQEAVATLPVEVAETETTTATTTTTTTTTTATLAVPAAEEEESGAPKEDPLSPVVTLPSDDTNNSTHTSSTTTIAGDEVDTDSVHVLQQQQQRVQVVEELLVVDQEEEGDSSELLPTEVTLVDVDAAIVTEPVDDFDVGVDVDVDALGLGLGEAEEVIVGVEGVEGVEVCEGGEFVAMATKEEVKPSHTVTMPSPLPVDDVPPDDTIPGDSLADKSIAEGVAGDEARGDDVVSKKVTEVTEKTVTIVEETVTTVEEVVSRTGEVVSKSVTDTVKVDQVSTLNESVVTGTEEAMDTEADKIAKKRLREDEAAAEANVEEVGEDGASVKRVKADVGGDAVNDVEMGEEKEAKVAAAAPVKLGPKVFNSSVEMFTYFYDFLHAWNVNENVNKYEFMVLSELIKQGNPQKEGVGITSFQVRSHPQWESRCYYLIRSDGSTDDFSYRKCVDKLMPLPESLFKSNGELDLQKLFPGQKAKHHNNHNGGRGGGGRGGRGYGGRGGGGRGGRGGGGRGKGGRWGR